MPKTYSTGAAAKRIGVSRQTLQMWIERADIPAPKLSTVGGVRVRLWRDSDIRKAQKFKGTMKPGRKAKIES